jgi:hypothetical protein
MVTNKLLLVGLAASSLIMPVAARAQRFNIEIGDRPYYTHGARYWEGEREMVWVPGHWSLHRRQWIHGHYVVGEHRRHGWDGRRDDRRGDDYRTEDNRGYDRR